LSLGADLNLQDNQGNTSLHLLATNKNSKELISLTTKILKRGAKTNIKNNEGKIPFDLIKKSDHEAEKLKKLLNPSCDFKRDF
jgi:ankyrin repeat protein